MHLLISDAQFNSVALILIALIGIIPATLAAVWSRSAKHSSAEAKNNSAGTLHEVKANGGMSDPDPTLKDYIKFVGENVEMNSRRIDKFEEMFSEHLKHSRLMDSALAEVFFAVKKDHIEEE